MINRICHRSPIQTLTYTSFPALSVYNRVGISWSKSQHDGKRMMPESRFPALSVYHWVGVSRSASETLKIDFFFFWTKNGIFYSNIFIISFYVL